MVIASRFKFPGLAASASAALLAGCASLSADRGLSEINPLLTARGGVEIKPPDADASDALRASMQGRTLGVADAQALAYAGNPRMQQLYAELGLAGADVLGAARLANPQLSLSLLDASSGGSQWTVGLAQPFANLLTMRSRQRLAAAEAAHAQLETGAAILQLGAEVEQAYWRLVGARQEAALATQIAKAATLSAELAQRYADAGNLAALPLNLERAAAAQAELERLKADAEVIDTQRDLAVLMGLKPDELDWQVPDRLPVPEGEPEALPDLQQRAMAQRLDLSAVRQQVANLESRLGNTRRTRALGDVTIGAEREREPDGSHLFGPTLELTLPLWNQNQSDVLRDLSELEIAQARQREIEIAAANEVATAHARLALASATLRIHQQHLLPAREQALQRMQERVNFMFESPFELLRSRQDSSAAYRSYVEALRDWWLARAALARAVGGLPPLAHMNESAQAESGVTTDAVIEPATDPHAHHHSHGDAP